MNSNETNQPLISVIVPVYNIIPYLPRCVESLQKQTYPELEILLIDDGSTDDTPALCDRLAENDPRIRVFHKENGGPSSARNFGLTQAAGAYVGFVDRSFCSSLVQKEQSPRCISSSFKKSSAGITCSSDTGSQMFGRMLPS